MKVKNMIHTTCLCLMSLLIGGFIMMSCSTGYFKVQRIDDISLPLTPLFRNYPNYLVSNESYSRFFKEKKVDSEVLDFVRKGEVFVLVKPEGDDGGGYSWYQVRSKDNVGWILALDPILVYSFEQAKQFQRLLGGVVE